MESNVPRFEFADARHAHQPASTLSVAFPGVELNVNAGRPSQVHESMFGWVLPLAFSQPPL